MTNKERETMSLTTIRKTIFLASSTDVVWQYLTNKDKSGDWFHPAAENLAEGKPYELLADANDKSSRICWGDVVSFKEPSFLSYTFTVKPMDGAMSTVSWTLEEIPGGTRVTLVHEGIGDSALGLLMALDKGWDEHFAKLRTMATP